jgi:hypothetical protein
MYLAICIIEPNDWEPTKRMYQRAGDVILMLLVYFWTSSYLRRRGNEDHEHEQGTLDVSDIAAGERRWMGSKARDSVVT